MGSRKRQIALLLLLALIVPILAACGGGGDAGSPTTAPAAGGDTTTGATAIPGGGPTADPAADDATAEPAAGDATAAPATGDATAEPSAGGATGTEGATAGASGDVTQIQVEQGAQLRFGAAGNPTEQQLYQEGAARFNELFADQNVTLTFEPINDYQTAMKAQMAGGTAPDVFLLDGELMGAFAPNGLLLPLDDAMSTAGVEVGDYFDPTIELYQQDGATYGIPKDFNPLVLFINNQLAEQAGVDPAGIETWDDWKSAAQAMTQGEGPGKTYGLCLNPDVLRSGALVFQNGNAFIENNQAVFNQPNGVEAIEFWKSFKDEGTGELFGELGRGWCGEAFAASSTAMAVEGGWMVPFLADPANGAQDLAYTAIPLPTPEGGEQATWLFTNGFAANAKTQYPNAAAAAVLYLSSYANQQALIPSGLAQPSLKALQEDPYYQENETASVLVQQGENGRLADTVLGGPVKKGDVLKPINDAMERIFLGAQTTQEALDQAAQEVNDVLAR